MAERAPLEVRRTRSLRIIGSGLRREILINDTPTVEVDFKGLHIAILSAEQGLAMEGDPYELPPGLVPGTAEH